MSDSLDRTREHRASLRAAMGEVESALAAPAPGRERAWRRGLAGKLIALSEALERHIASTEAEDGILAEIVSATPRLAHRIERARTDHDRLRSHLERTCAAVDEDADVAVLRDEVAAVLTDLARHRQLGSDLIYEAYNVDIEAGD